MLNIYASIMKILEKRPALAPISEEKRANKKYVNMTADDRKLGTGFYHIRDYKL